MKLHDHPGELEQVLLLALGCLQPQLQRRDGRWLGHENVAFDVPLHLAVLRAALLVQLADPESLCPQSTLRQTLLLEDLKQHLINLRCLERQKYGAKA